MSVSNKTRKVVVTGISMISPLGANKVANWNSVIKSSGNAIVRITDPAITSISNCKIGGVLTKDVFDPSEYPTSLKFRTSSLAAALAEQALQDSAMNMESMSEAELRRTGIVISN